jgi:glycine/D-amino acid oxidase-like deaminating enzyme
MRHVVIAGAGIVGAALAAELSAEDGLDVTVVERGPRDRLLGSTGHAPGFVGVFNEAPVLTALARASAETYEAMEHAGQVGFDRASGLEIAGTAAGMDDLHRRAALAAEQGLQAHVLDADQAVAAAPDLVDRQRCLGGVVFPEDGTARADVIVAALRDRAVRTGARFVYDMPVTAIDVRAGRVRAVHATDESLIADDVVIACGIWGPAVAALAGQSLPLVPVGHPYVYGPARGASTAATPFVRWPEHHVYARDHGDRLGLGTYDHVPLPVESSVLGTDAEQPWSTEVFDPAVQQAIELLPSAQRFIPSERLNGVFSMTADNQPLLGPLGNTKGLWAAEALWVTHAAGAARGLADLMMDRPSRIAGLDTLQPTRFEARTPEELTAAALHHYRDIYATD